MSSINPVCHFLVSCISWVTQRSISPISLMCFEKHTCILRKHSVRLELVPPPPRPQRTMPGFSKFTQSENLHVITPSIKFPRKLPDVFVLCAFLAAAIVTVLSLQSVRLDVKGQVREFGERTKSTTGNLTFKSKAVFLKLLQKPENRTCS